GACAAAGAAAAPSTAAPPASTLRRVTGVAANAARVSQQAQPDKRLRPVVLNIGVSPSTVRQASAASRSQHSSIMERKKCIKARKSVFGRYSSCQATLFATDGRAAP